MRRVQLSILFVLALVATAVAFVALLAFRTDLASVLSACLSSERILTLDTCGPTCRLALSPAKERTSREPAAPEAPTFDAVQVSPDGPSVFAGRAPPGSHVAVLVNQRPFANATADEHGDWVAVTEKKIGGGDHQFSLARAARPGRRTDLRPDRRKVRGVAASHWQQSDAGDGQRSSLACRSPGRSPSSTIRPPSQPRANERRRCWPNT